MNTHIPCLHCQHLTDIKMLCQLWRRKTFEVWRPTWLVPSRDNLWLVSLQGEFSRLRKCQRLLLYAVPCVALAWSEIQIWIFVLAFLGATLWLVCLLSYLLGFGMELSEYELERRKRIAENEKILKGLGLMEMVHNIFISTGTSTSFGFY